MGFGIEARYERCRRFWEPHLRCCNEFQSKAFSINFRGTTLFVLGAGRLLDFNLEAALSSFEKLHLVDADPGCEKIWLKRSEALSASERIKGEILDISGAIDSWTEVIDQFCSRSNSVEDLVKIINTLALPRSSTLNLESGNKNYAILSLNLLSQIPIYFRDRIAQILLKHWKLDSDKDGQYAAPLQNAICSSMRKLEKQHIELLAKSGAKQVSLITDSYFHYYRKDISDWRTERALNSFEYDQKGAQIKLEGYNLKERQSWLWHIAPQSIEHKSYGVIHEVIGCSFVPNK